MLNQTCFDDTNYDTAQELLCLHLFDCCLHSFNLSPVEFRKDNIQLKRKHSALRTCHRGVKVSGAEEVSPSNLSSKYKILPSAEVKKVRESLKSSSMELKALVKDPLPDALRSSEDVRSKLATEHINLGPSSENQSGHVDVRHSDRCKSIVLYQAKANDANLAKKPSVPCSNDRRPNFMGRASSAHTYEVIINVMICSNLGVDSLLYSYILSVRA